MDYHRLTHGVDFAGEDRREARRTARFEHHLVVCMASVTSHRSRKGARILCMVPLDTEGGSLRGGHLEHSGLRLELGLRLGFGGHLEHFESGPHGMPNLVVVYDEDPLSTNVAVQPGGLNIQGSSFRGPGCAGR